MLSYISWSSSRLAGDIFYSPWAFTLFPRNSSYKQWSQLFKTIIFKTLLPATHSSFIAITTIVKSKWPILLSIKISTFHANTVKRSKNYKPQVAEFRRIFYLDFLKLQFAFVVSKLLDIVTFQKFENIQFRVWHCWVALSTNFWTN